MTCLKSTMETSFYCVYCYLLTDFTYCFGYSIANLEQQVPVRLRANTKNIYKKQQVKSQLVWLFKGDVTPNHPNECSKY